MLQEHFSKLCTIRPVRNDTLIGVFSSALHGSELASCNQLSPGGQHHQQAFRRRVVEVRLVDLLRDTVADIVSMSCFASLTHVTCSSFLCPCGWVCSFSSRVLGSHLLAVCSRVLGSRSLSVFFLGSWVPFPGFFFHSLMSTKSSMQILLSCGTSSSTTILTFVCSFVSAVDANELSTWTRAPPSLVFTGSLYHLLILCFLASFTQKRSPYFNEQVQFLSFSEPLLGLLLQHPSVPDPPVVHHASPCSSSSGRHISCSRTAPLPLRINCRVQQYSLCSCGSAACVSRCPGTISDQMTMWICMRQQR